MSRVVLRYTAEKCVYRNLGETALIAQDTRLQNMFPNKEVDKCGVKGPDLFVSFVSGQLWGLVQLQGRMMALDRYDVQQAFYLRFDVPLCQPVAS
jgi:hypothetical protein